MRDNKSSGHFSKSALSVLFVVLLLFMFNVCDARKNKKTIQVAVFNAEKGIAKSADRLIATMTGEDGKIFNVIRITGDEIRDGKLADVDVVVFPGGSASQQSNFLEVEGREKVRNFIAKGGGYLGVCAGAYLATNTKDIYLHILDAKVVDRKHWARGHGDVEIQFSPEGSNFFDYHKKITICYYQGPLLARPEWDDPKLPSYESLAIFATEIATRNNAPEGIMVGTSAIVRSNYGKGRVMCFSPHPEKTEGCGWMIRKAVEWLANR